MCASLHRRLTLTFSSGIWASSLRNASRMAAFASQVVPVLPYLLSFAAGAVFYVVVEELIPEMSEGKHSNVGIVAFALGFVVMMVLDVALG